MDLSNQTHGFLLPSRTIQYDCDETVKGWREALNGISIHGFPSFENYGYTYQLYNSYKAIDSTWISRALYLQSFIASLRDKEAVWNEAVMLWSIRNGLFLTLQSMQDQTKELLLLVLCGSASKYSFSKDYSSLSLYFEGYRAMTIQCCKEEEAVAMQFVKLYWRL